MVSIVISVLCCWAFLPLLRAYEGLIVDSQELCVFPFTFNSKSYSACTTDGDPNGMLWCSLTSNYDIEPKRIYCGQSAHLDLQNLADPLTRVLWPISAAYESMSIVLRDLQKLRAENEFSGNNSCVFPFAYNGQTYFTCTNKNDQDGRFWCATTGSYDKNRKWTNCTEVDVNSHGPCVFPFIYNGTIYSSCTTAGSSTGKLWCSLTSNYDENPKLTYCTPSEPRPCVFPFIFRDRSYYKCTRKGAGDNVLWCATTDNYDRDTKWKICSSQEYEGTSHGQPCFFPFIYKGRTFFTCTNENEHEENGRFWCATSGSYDKEKKWSYCADTRLDISPTGPCVFPFIYGGKSYSTCTTDGPSLGMFWCSLSSNYDEDPKWTYCKFSEQRPCVFPFIYNGEPYSTCTRKGSADDLLWCATTANYDRDTKWKTCAMQEYEGNSKGKPCIFPFIYRKRSFHSCTNEYSEDGRFWCATTRNYDKDMQWSYCADTRVDANSIGTCVFPFIYKGQNYSSCTSDGTSNSKLWCSLTSNYDVDPRWTYCTY